MPDPLDPLDVTKLLATTDIRFVLIGGLALQAIGGSYQTDDTDISFAMDDENLQKLTAWINPFHPRPLGFPVGSGFQVTPNLLKTAKFLVLKTDLGPIDLLKHPDGIDSFEGLWERSVPMDLGGFVVRVASLDDLIAMKEAAGRTKDQLHLLELRALKRLYEEKE